jgi:hypothetical protein
MAYRNRLRVVQYNSALMVVPRGMNSTRRTPFRSQKTRGGIIDFLIHFKHSLKLFKYAIGAKLTWNKANGRLRSSDLESARSVDLRERYAQTVFTFWTTLVLTKGTSELEYNVFIFHNFHQNV